MSRHLTTRAVAFSIVESAAQSEDIEMLRVPAVMKMTALPLSSLYELMAAGDFPKPVALSRHRVAWVRSEVEQWLRERIAASRAPQRTVLRRHRPRAAQRVQIVNRRSNLALTQFWCSRGYMAPIRRA
jgi:prophage regulatory protein